MKQLTNLQIYLILLLCLTITPFFSSSAQLIELDDNMMYGKFNVTQTRNPYSPEAPKYPEICPNEFSSLGTAEVCYSSGYISGVFSIESIHATNIEDEVYFYPNTITFDDEGYQPVGDYEIIYLYYVGKTPTIQVNYTRYSLKETSSDGNTIDKSINESDSYNMSLLSFSKDIMIPYSTTIYHDVDLIIIAKDPIESKIQEYKPKVKMGNLLYAPQFFIDTHQDFHWELKTASGVVKIIECKEFLLESEYKDYDQIRVYNETFMSKYYINERLSTSLVVK